MAAADTAAKPKAVTPEDIWNALQAAGASSIQAAAIMGNAIAESGLNPEAQVTDSNGYTSSGLWQFNAQSYPGSENLVTGNPVKDMENQVKFLAQVGGFKAASGSTPTQAANNFAKNFERCSTCQAGGASNAARQAYATTVAGWASGDNWPASSGSASDNATLTAADTSAAQSGCLIQWPSAKLTPIGPTFGGGCIFAKSEARAVIGGTMVIFGGVVILAGVILLAATAFSGSQVAGKASSVAAVVPGAKGASVALAGVQSRANSTGAGVRSQRQSQARTAAASERRTAQQPRGRHAKTGANAPARGRHARD